MTKQILKKILIVDDDQDILTLTKYCISKMSQFDAKYIHSGEEAIQEALIFKPDLILLDVMMPKMDGFATLKAIRLLPSIAHIPVVFFTAKVQKDELESYYNQGIINVIIKPFDPLSFVDTINKIWQTYTAST